MEIAFWVLLCRSSALVWADLGIQSDPAHTKQVHNLVCLLCCLLPNHMTVNATNVFCMQGV